MSARASRAVGCPSPERGAARRCGAPPLHSSTRQACNTCTESHRPWTKNCEPAGAHTKYDHWNPVATCHMAVGCSPLSRSRRSEHQALSTPLNNCSPAQSTRSAISHNGGGHAQARSCGSLRLCNVCTSPRQASVHAERPATSPEQTPWAGPRIALCNLQPSYFPHDRYHSVPFSVRGKLRRKTALATPVARPSDLHCGANASRLDRRS